jgi:predicted nucleic acid-binding protein
VKIYVDSSELVDRADALLHGRSWDVPTELLHMVSSDITVVEVSRVLLRDHEPAGVPALVASALTMVDVVASTPAVLALAASLPVRHLRSLDAIHVASALITRCDIVLTRDRQMARACEELGLQVA